MTDTTNVLDNPVEQPIVEPTTPVNEPSPYIQAGSPVNTINIQPENKVEVEGEVKNPPTTVSFDDANSAMEISLRIMEQQTGITEDDFCEALKAAIQYRDPALINLGNLTQKLDATQAQYVQALAKTAYQEALNVADNAVKSAYQAAGGEAQWKNTVTLFNTQADKNAKGYALYLEQQGKVEDAIAYVLQTVKGLSTQPNIQQAALTPSNGVATSGQGISASDFRSAITKLTLEINGQDPFTNKQTADKAKQLYAQRQLGQRRGL